MRKALLGIFAAAALAAVFCAAASADVIEVKGRGMLTGKINHENKDGVTFTDSWGVTKTYPHDQVTYLERTPESIAKRAKELKKSKSKDKDGKSEDKKGGGSIFSSLPFGLDQFGLDQNWATTLQKGLTLWSNFWSGDVEKSPEEVFREAMERAKNIKKTVTNNDKTQQIICFSGMGIILIGLLGLTLFSWQLIFAAFEDGLMWGFMMLGAGLANFAPMVGGDAGLVLLIPQLFVFYFIVTRWDVSRSSVVNQIVFMNVIIIGYMIMRSAG